MIKELIPENWAIHLKDEYAKPYFSALEKLVENAYNNSTVFPPRQMLFNALQLCAPEDIKVVILGQDPYHEPNQAHGLAFSVSDNCKRPGSLAHIFEEIGIEMGIGMEMKIDRNLKNEMEIGIELEIENKTEIGRKLRKKSETESELKIKSDDEGEKLIMVQPQSNNLTKWAQQGVLLLNTILTVETHKAGSHRSFGWQNLSDAIISVVNQVAPHAVFMLWGGDAHKKSRLIDAERHRIIKSTHPSGLPWGKSSNPAKMVGEFRYNGFGRNKESTFWGSMQFIEANNFLIENGLSAIDWR